MRRRVHYRISHGECRVDVMVGDTILPQERSGVGGFVIGRNCGCERQWCCVKKRARGTGLYRARKEAGQGGSGCRLEHASSYRNIPSADGNGHI